MQKRKKTTGGSKFFTFRFSLLPFFITFDCVALGIPKDDACYQRDARKYFRSKKTKIILVFCSLIRTFAPEITKK